MPSVMTYIRQADYDKYAAIIEKKGWSEFIHNALNTTDLFKEKFAETNDAVQDSVLKPIKTPKQFPTKDDDLDRELRKIAYPPIPKSFSARKKK